MTFKLKSRTREFPPSGFLFTDPKTGMKFSDGDFNGVVRLIIAHRRANPRIYPPDDIEHLNFDLVSEELDAYTCARLGNDPRICESGEPVKLEPAAGAALIDMPRPCHKCGHKRGWEMLCQTCSGRKVSGYICEACCAPNGR